MHPIIDVVLKAGLISKQQLEEMKRFSPVIDREAEVGEPVNLELASRLVADALEREEYVLVRETDLEVMRQYASSSATGVLHIESDGDITSFAVTFGRTKLGDYIIAWKGESIKELMTNGTTFLLYNMEEIYFQDVRELFFGEQKAFMVCKPSKVEKRV